MRIVMPIMPIRIARHSLFSVGFFLLGFWAWGAISDMVVQHNFSNRLDRLIVSGETAEAREPAAPEAGALLGRIDIEAVDVSGVILEGTNTELQYAIGHVEGTALPGESGNVALAAHRDALFRGLRNLKLQDVATITTPDAIYNYTVEDMRIVTPEDVSVLNATPDPALTLVTCYPFDYIGPAPLRFIVRARQTNRSSHLR